MAVNLVLNPNFDGNDLTGWTVEGNIGSYSGQAAFSISNGPTNGVLSQVLTVTPGKTYNFEFNFGFASDGRTGSTSGTYEVVTEPGGATIISGAFSDATPIQYTNYAADSILQTSFVVPDGVTSVRIIFRDTTRNSNRRDLVLDNVVVALCFAAGTQILTDQGPKAVEDLQVGDLVQTLHRGAQPIRWIGCKKLLPRDLVQRPELSPIKIDANALGRGIPATDLVVSPQHRIMVSSKIAARICGAEQVLVAAKKLVGLPGVTVMKDAVSVDYWHLLCDNHEVVFANGAAAETLYLGPQALIQLDAEAVCEIKALFPDLLQGRIYAPALTILAGQAPKQLVARHIKNKKPLVAA